MTFLQKKDNQNQFLLREFTFNDKKEYEKTLDLLQSKQKQLDNNEHITPLVKYLTRAEDQFCSTFYKIYALYQYPQRTLDDEINERNLKKRRFQEQ